MLCEKPIVASINRGHKELIEDGVTGYLLEADDADAFAGRMIDLLCDPALARRMGAAGKKRAARYTDCTVYRELEEIYGAMGIL